MTDEPICYTCKTPIEGKLLSALDRSYHPKCFLCAKCKKPIKDNTFQTHEGEPYCAKDYAQLFAPKCHACKKPITDRIVKALGHDWHEEHFVCSICQTPMSGKNFMEQDGRPLCETCYKNNVADKCHGCGKGITDKMLIALNAKWHPECFKCSICKQPITDDLFQVVNDLPVCSKCSPQTSIK